MRSGCCSATSHFAESWARGSSSGSVGLYGVSVPYHGWVPPLVFAFTGFLLVALGIGSRHRRAR